MEEDSNKNSTKRIILFVEHIRISPTIQNY